MKAAVYWCFLPGKKKFDKPASNWQHSTRPSCSLKLSAGYMASISPKRTRTGHSAVVAPARKIVSCNGD